MLTLKNSRLAVQSISHNTGWQTHLARDSLGPSTGVRPALQESASVTSPTTPWLLAEPAASVQRLRSLMASGFAAQLACGTSSVRAAGGRP